MLKIIFVYPNHAYRITESDISEKRQAERYTIKSSVKKIFSNSETKKFPHFNFLFLASIPPFFPLPPLPPKKKPISAHKQSTPFFFFRQMEEKKLRMFPSIQLFRFLFCILKNVNTDERRFLIMSTFD